MKLLHLTRGAALVALLSGCLLVGETWARKSSAPAASKDDEQQGRYLDDVIKSVGAFVRGKRNSFPETMSDLYRAFKEFKALPEAEQRKLSARKPLNKLVIDFAIKPMKFVKFLLSADEFVRDKYLERMRAVLRAFYPAYKGIQFSNVDPIARKPKMELLCSILYETRDDLPELELSHFLQAKYERSAWLSRAEQIIDHEDIYSNLDEYVRILQYLNREDYKLIHKFVLPHVTRRSKVDGLRRLFEETKDLDEPAVEYALA